MQLKLNESICEYEALSIEKELADSQIESLMKSEKEPQESVNGIDSFLLQLHEERNQRLREYEDLKLRFDSLETEKKLHLEMVSRPFVVCVAYPSRIRLVVNEHDQKEPTPRQHTASVAASRSSSCADPPPGVVSDDGQEGNASVV
jgi:predicted nuclease with TOPRIM domain